MVLSPKSAKSKMQTRCTLMVSQSQDLRLSNIKRDKYFFLTFGLLGAHLAKLQWLIINTCLRQEARIGVTKFD